MDLGVNTKFKECLSFERNKSPKKVRSILDIFLATEYLKKSLSMIFIFTIYILTILYFYNLVF